MDTSNLLHNRPILFDAEGMRDTPNPLDYDPAHLFENSWTFYLNFRHGFSRESAVRSPDVSRANDGRAVTNRLEDRSIQLVSSPWCLSTYRTVLSPPFPF